MERHPTPGVSEHHTEDPMAKSKKAKKAKKCKFGVVKKGQRKGQCLKNKRAKKR